jgi:hypothetical protein
MAGKRRRQASPRSKSSGALKIGLQRPFKDRSPRVDLIILVAIIAIFALIIMFLKFPA